MNYLSFVGAWLERARILLRAKRHPNEVRSKSNGGRGQAKPLQLFFYLFILSSAVIQTKASNWTYVEVDNSRQKWGDWDEPEWLRYFGLDAGDVNHDRFPDIVSGRYVYLNPKGNLSEPWQRIDLGQNTDGALFVDVDGDEYADLISTSLPQVFWCEATDKSGKTWKKKLIAEIPATGHVNGQGFHIADIIQGGREEILIAAGNGLYALIIPTDASNESWISINLIPNASDEGFDVGDLDADGDLDIATSAYVKEGESHAPKQLFWWQNPGSFDDLNKARTHLIHESRHDIDRIEIVDLDGDGRNDIVYSEERYPGLEADAELVWLKAPASCCGKWDPTVLITQFSMNNLDSGDIDGDGDIDLVTSEHKGQQLQVQWFENDGAGHFSVRVIDTGKEMHLGTQLVDFDGDGDLDLYGHAWDRYQFLHLWRNDK